MNFRKILVIGGTGFIGTYLVKNLAQRGDVEIQVVHAHSAKDAQKISGVEYCQMDAGEESDALRARIRENDCIVSLARPNRGILQNIVSGMHPSSKKRIIYASTLLVYPDSSKCHSENTEPAPLTHYEKEKIFEEEMLKKMSATGNYSVAIARMGNVYGDVQNSGLIHHLLSAAMNETFLTVNGNGEHTRDYIFVQDASNLLEFLIFHDMPTQYEIFNVSSGRGYTIEEIISHAQKVFGREIKKIHNERIEEKLSVMGNNEKILKASGYQMKYDILSGLKKTHENYWKEK